MDAYRHAYADWLSLLSRIPFHQKWVQPILDAAKLTNDEISWLPLIKAPLPARSSPHEDAIARDKIALWDQLMILRPSILWLQGLEAIERVGRMCENKFPHHTLCQKIPQYPKAAWIAIDRTRLIKELTTALHSQL